MSDCTSVQKQKYGAVHGWACLQYGSNDAFVLGATPIWTIDSAVDA
jgi:hypothetical protein